MKADIKILGSKDQLGTYAADLLSEWSTDIISRNGSISVALSGGSTPKLMYSKLVDFYSEDIKWDYFKFFWSDERYVPFEHEESNAGMAYRHLLEPLGISKDQYEAVPTSLKEPFHAAMEYENSIRQHFGTPDAVPAFDIVFLGMGADGHTASLFPNTKALHERRRLVTANWVEELDTWRVTFTYTLINQAKTTILLVSGADKAQVVKEILHEGNTSYPVSHVQPKSGNVLWLLDADAGARL